MNAGRFGLIVVSGLVCGWMSVAPTRAADDVDALQSRLDNKQTTEAWSLAEQLSTRHAGEPRFDLLYARAALATGHSSEAVFALERLRLTHPQDYSIWLMLAEAHLQAGDREHARSDLDTLLAGNPPEAVRDKAKRLMVRVTPSETRPWHASLGLDYGYDSNVNSATDQAVILGANGNPLMGVVLPSSSLAVHDTLARLSADVGGQHAMANTLLFGGVSGSATFLHDETIFDTSVYKFSAGARWQWASSTLTVPVSRQVLSVNHSPYNTYDLFGIEWSTPVAANQRLVLAVNRGMSAYADMPTLDVHVTTATIGWATLVGRARIGANVRYGHNDPRVDFDAGAGVSNGYIGSDSYAAVAEANYLVLPNHIARAGLMFQGSRYDGADPVFKIDRHDQFAYALLGWDWRVWRELTLRAEVNYATNHSNVGLYTFDKTQVLMGVRYDFR